jgi:L-threonylcarbamoyladenylate synthase
LKTEVMPADHPRALIRAQEVLRGGGLIAFPTDTVYGLGAEIGIAEAVAQLNRIKGRMESKAIPVLAAHADDLRQVAKPLPGMAIRLIDRFWPGPLTLVVWRLPELSRQVSPFETVGVRVPDHAFTLALLAQTGPLAVTSANRAGGSDPLSAEDVLAVLGGTFDLLLDGGPAPGGMASSVVDCTQEEPRLLRRGPISAESITEALL